MKKQPPKTKKKIENSFLHDGTIGDVWASLAGVKECCVKSGVKAIFYLEKDVVAHYYEGAVHPTIDAEGKNVMLNGEMINMMLPLLKAQPYIEDARLHKKEKIRVKLNRIRDTFVNMPYHSLAKWYFYIYPDLTCDLSKQYIFTPDTKIDYGTSGTLIIARTERYLNIGIDYHFLTQYNGELIFAGTHLEHTIFNARFGLNIPKLHVNDFLELAQAVKQSKGTLTNQTMLAQIAEGMKTPRIVELCKLAPNVCFVGKDAYEFYGQEGVEYAVAVLLGKENPVAMVNKKTQ